MTQDEPRERRWSPRWPCSPALALAPLRHGGGDPTWQRGEDGAVWRGIRTPEGAATLRVLAEPTTGTVLGQAWGPGAQWALETMPRALGAEDDPSGFVPRHPVLVHAWRRHHHWRLGASGLVMESLVPAVIEQKVTGQEAFAAFRRLVLRFGTPAPGPAASWGLHLPPEPSALLAIPSWEWLRLPVDGARSRPVVHAARVASALERLGHEGPDALDHAVRSLPGIGVWTSAEVRSRALGDADAVSFGDFHIPADIGFALTGRPVDDAGLAELLEPYAGHRHRVQRLVQLAGITRPRRGPRMAPRRHLPG